MASGGWEELLIEVSKDSNSEPFAAKRWGDANGEPWLLLHGWLDNANSFDLLAPLLVQRLPSCQLVCLDMAGHGRSRHRREGTYQLFDYVADAFLVVEALGWTQFNVLGHSLGQSVASLLSGTFPNRVKRLVMIEGLGPQTDQPEDAPGALEKSLNAFVAPRRPKKIYESREQAAERRMQGNAVGPLPREAATILVSRGTSPRLQPSEESLHKSLLRRREESAVWRVPSDSADSSDNEAPSNVEWNFDAVLQLPSRSRLTEDVLQNFLKRIRCPVLLVLAQDGLLSAYGARPTFLTSFWGRCLLHVAHSALYVLSSVPLVGRKLLPIYKASRLGASLARRYTAIPNLRSTVLSSGGHHPHLSSTHAEMIAVAIADWFPNVEEIPFEATVRFRTVGDMTCTAAVLSEAIELDDIIGEILSAEISERGARIDDKRSEAAMEKRKQQGYF